MTHESALLTNETLPPLRLRAQGGSSVSIVQRAKALLLGSSHQPLRSVRCVYHGGALRLRGWVPNFYLKQVAQSLLLSMEEAPQVQNELIVGRPHEPDQTK